jgi:ubiquinone/menaquinone biosynthesis C-methylase UbiE
MSSGDTLFAGSIPALYDRCMVPMLFEPYASDLAARAASLHPRQILETAAGTGAVTAALASELPDSRIVATDLNQAMLDVAVQRIHAANMTFEQADAQSLPFGEASFDLVLCQFGVMFFPDRVKAYSEAHRVLRPDGCFLFNVWSRIEENPVPAALSDALAALFPENPPSFFRRVPHGYHDRKQIEADLCAAGFDRIVVETVEQRCRARSAEQAAIGLCHGSPLRAELEALGPGALDKATEAATLALSRLSGANGIDAPMSAHVVSARTR